MSTARVPQSNSAPTPITVDSTDAPTLTRAISPIRRSPLSNAPCEPLATVRPTPNANQPTSSASCALPSNRAARGSRKNQTNVTPPKASIKVPQNRARRAAAIPSESSRADASAICRVPTLPNPKAATLEAVAIRFWNNPIRPIQQGPAAPPRPSFLSG